MFVHIGSHISLKSENIIGIFDLDTSTTSKYTKEFLKVAEEEGFIETINTDLPVSFILAEVNKNSKVYLSSVAPLTLKKRLYFYQDVDNADILSRYR